MLMFIPGTLDLVVEQSGLNFVVKFLLAFVEKERG
jgi:hypothetical protein